jgi:alpha-1,6-mannosyltransferase
VKIVDVCAFYSPLGGGVRTYVEQKLLIGPTLGHEIVILAPGEADRTELRGPLARIEWLASPRFPLDRRYRYFETAARIQQILAREQPDFVEASSPWRSATAVAAWGGRAPRSLVMHSDPIAAYAYRWFEGFASVATIDRRVDWAWRYLRRLAGEFELVVSASPSLSDRLRAAGLTNLATHPMGVEPGLFSPALRDPALRTRMLERCALREDAALLVGVGRHAPEKRWPMVVQAVNRAGAERPVGLLLVGDGRQRSKLAREIGGNAHVHLVLPLSRPDLARVMASCDALIHGCEAETFSMVAAEAVASGLRVIAPDRGGAADHAMAAGGFRFRAGDPTDAARAILECLRRPNAPSGTRHRTMDDHFRDLFAHYESVARTSKKAA